MTIDEARAEFPVLERLAYLNAGTNGPLARPTDRRDDRAGAVSTSRSGRGGADHFCGRARAARARPREARRRGRRRAARDAPSRSPTSTTNGCNIVLAGLGLGAEDEVLTTDGESTSGLLGALAASPAQVRRGSRARRCRRTKAFDVLLARGDAEDAPASPSRTSAG